MDILLDPNVAYLLLVLMTLLALLAIITPGTGVLEVGTLFSLVLAGYAVYNISFNWWALLILFVSLAPFIYGIRKPKREAFLVLSILGFVAGSVFFFTENGKPAVHPLLAVVVSIVYAVSLWIVIRKTLQAAHVRPVHDLGSLIGQIGEARTNIHADGSVQVEGELWSARSEQAISIGSRVRIVNRDGFVLLVESDDKK